MNIAASPRIPNDFYPTDHGFTRVMLESLPVRLSGNISEPCAGQRDIVQCLRQSGLQVIDSDIVDGPGADATTAEFWKSQGPIDWTVTNPPFNVATKILQKAYEHSRCGVLFFLRITYLEPCPDRAEWLDEHADQLRWMQVVNPRPIFRPETNKTDSATCCWLLWDKSWSWAALGIEPPFRFSHGTRSPTDSRKTVFAATTPKLLIASSLPTNISVEKNAPNRLPQATDRLFSTHKYLGREERLESPTVQCFAAALQEAALMGESISDRLRNVGVAPDGATIREMTKGGRSYWFMVYRQGNRKKPKHAALKGEALVVAREQIDRRNTYNWLNHRIAAVYEIIAELRRRSG